MRSVLSICTATAFSVCATGCPSTSKIEIDSGLIDDIGDITIEACDGMTIEELITADVISEDCKEALESYLPEPEDNLSGNVIAAGSASDGDSEMLYVLGADADGVPVDLATAVIAVRAGGEELPSTSYTVHVAADLDGVAASLPCSLDYSGSMTDLDIDDAVSFYEALFSIPLGYEAEYAIFSDTVYEKAAFTSDVATLQAAAARDATFTRGSTALFDAIGAGIDAVADREAPVRLLVVATDGGENSSTIYTDKAALYDAAVAAGVHVVVVGSLMSDLDFMREAASKTDGFYFYAHSFGDLEAKTDALIAAISAMGAVEITDPVYIGAGPYEIEIDGVTITF